MNALLMNIVRRYISCELPGWGMVYSNFVGNFRKDSAWIGHPMRAIRGKLHGYEMDLDLARWSERQTYFLGRFYDLETQLLLIEMLRSGDRFIDIGANIGMISLLASRLVGPEGIVDSFEPNPKCAARIESFIQRNSIQNIRLHPFALADVDRDMQLTVPVANSGEGTLTKFGGESTSSTLATEVFDVAVRIGDSAIASDSRPPALIKIDVEGFEYQVLSGLQQTLKRHRPPVIAEVVSQHLSRAGHVPGDLFNLMDSYGYKSFAPHVRRRWLGNVLSIEPTTASYHGDNVIWLSPDSPVLDRFRG